MTDGGGWPGEDTAETEVLALSRTERQVLAALAVVGRASLSADELAELTETDQVRPLIDGLERRGLVKRDEERRYSLAGRIGDQIRKSDEALSTGDRLLQYVTTLARGGKLTPERLAEDAEAILGLSGWAAENRQWASLLELVKTLQACFGIAHRVDEWLALLERGRVAAQALGDRSSEVWILQQMATASASVGNTSAAQRYLREADELQRGPAPAARRVAADQAVAAGGAGGGGLASRMPWIIGLVVAAGAGIGAGFALGNDDGSVGGTTVRVPVTLTAGGTTVTTSDTVTLPATTVISTTTEVTTTTVTATTTVTVVG